MKQIKFFLATMMLMTSAVVMAQTEQNDTVIYKESDEMLKEHGECLIAEKAVRKLKGGR